MVREPAPPPEWSDAVRRHWDDTVGYLVAQSAECLDVQTQESWGPATRVPGRRFKPVPPAELGRLVLPTSWFMGIILCPGDDLAPVLAWFASLRWPDRDRVVLYVHPGVDEGGVRMAWAENGLGEPRTVLFDGSWAGFHKLFGLHHAERVLRDHPA